ncbi:ammonia-dependent NAD(+) synthetase [Bacillus taeanensis]|uniref:NH(3)-dependent NAD(+) synthetase n=1 Tax=Bacillus taeanensis TaxID=273032 RepID=A0A366XSB4_9BACI|nr:ammonia-dependent NAD(+) synthetase [Bacillus taeanensis]RBW68025.1 NAD(+) synthase [Bacillus taeanensis]
MQKEIIEVLGVKPSINPQEEIRKRVDFLKDYVVKTNTKGYVLGISGGQDSTLAGKLAQMAVNELNEQKGTNEYQFFAVRLPYGVQADEEDCQIALQFIQPTKIITVDIKPAVDAAVESFREASGEVMRDFVKGNTKARERMKAQYDLAAQFGMLVIGTDHAAEAVTGFFTKYGDGACDVAPLYGLNKRQGRAMLKELDGPEQIMTKAPTADLEDDRPQLPDEAALGVTYEQIDDFLEGKAIEEDAQKAIEAHYMKTEHKRRGPVTVFDSWYK